MRFGTWNATVKAEAAPVVPKYPRATTSRMRPAMRLRPVAAEKIAVFRASPVRARARVAARWRPASAAARRRRPRR